MLKLLAIISCVASLLGVFTLNQLLMAHEKRAYSPEHLQQSDYLIIGNSQANAILHDGENVQHLWEHGSHFIQRQEQLRLIADSIAGKTVISSIEPMEMLVDPECAALLAARYIKENARFRNTLLRVLDRMFWIATTQSTARPQDIPTHYYSAYSMLSELARVNFRIQIKPTLRHFTGVPQSTHFRPNGAEIAEDRAAPRLAPERIWQGPVWKTCHRVGEASLVIQKNINYLRHLAAGVQAKGGRFMLAVTPVHPAYRESANDQLGNGLSYPSLINRLMQESDFQTLEYSALFDTETTLFNDGIHLSNTGNHRFTQHLLNDLPAVENRQ